MTYEDENYHEAHCKRCNRTMWFGKMASGRFACSTCLSYEDDGGFPGGEFMRQRSGYDQVRYQEPQYNTSAAIGYGSGNYNTGNTKLGDCYWCRRETVFTRNGRDWNCQVCGRAE